MLQKTGKDLKQLLWLNLKELYCRERFSCGYLNRTELMTEKCIEIDLFCKTERIYKIADLACWLSDGHLDYLGRIDHQIKGRVTALNSKEGSTKW
jgi:non-ribosomal peptide synthetase component F